MKTLATATLFALLIIGAGCGKQEDAEGTRRRPWVALHTAALQGNVDAIRQHIEAGSDLDQKDAYGSTPLAVAATFVYDGDGNLYRAMEAGTVSVPEQAFGPGSDSADMPLQVIFTNPAFGDINNDGRQDFVLATASYYGEIYFQTVTGTFTQHKTIAIFIEGT